jgi:hypothetical protein
LAIFLYLAVDRPVERILKNMFKGNRKEKAENDLPMNGDVYEECLKEKN